MTGAEPGGAWETAPLPVVAEAGANESPVGARQAARVAPEVRTDEMRVPAPKVGAPTGTSPSVVIVSRAAAPVAPVTPSSPWTEPEPAPIGPEEPALAAVAVPEPGGDAAAVESVPTVGTADDDPPAVPAVPAQVDPDVVAEPAAPVSRPLSDPDLTPLMGIPIIRPVAVDAVPIRVPVAVPETLPEPAVPAAPPVEFPGLAARHRHPRPGRRRGLPPAADPYRDVPGRPAEPFRQPQPCGSGWSAATVSRARRRRRPARRPRPEVDTAKTAVDGGGELHSPHAGRS